MTPVAVDLRLVADTWVGGFFRLLFMVMGLTLAVAGAIDLGAVGHGVPSSYGYDHEVAAYDDAVGLGGANAVVEDAMGRQLRSAAAIAGPSLALSGELLAPRAPMRLPVPETWGNPNTLARHFRDHGADFAARSADEYANMASDFFQRSQFNRLPTKIDADGVIRVYDPATNTFGAFNANGTTRTFFTPKRGIDYWYDQPGTSPWGP